MEFWNPILNLLFTDTCLLITFQFYENKNSNLMKQVCPWLHKITTNYLTSHILWFYEKVYGFLYLFNFLLVSNLNGQGSLVKYF